MKTSALFAKVKPKAYKISKIYKNLCSFSLSLYPLSNTTLPSPHFFLPCCNNITNPLQKAMDHKSIASQVRDLRTAFDLLDRNRDGRVTANELQFMLKNLGINVRDEIINDLIREASHSGNGLINEAEFLQWVGRIQALRDEQSQQQQQHEDNASKPDELDDVTEDLIAAFRVFDRDGNGFITRDELQTAMEMIGEPLNETQLTQLLAIADLDQDGKINYEEFTRLLL